MSEFQPENPTPTPNEAPYGAAPYQGMPDLQGQPFDPRRPYGQQPPVPDAARSGQQAFPTAAPAYGQMAPPAQPYAQVAPPAQPYAQPYAQAPAYGHAPPMSAPPQNPVWGVAPPTWNATPAKKRKVWPWVVGGVGALVVLGGVGAVVILGVIGANNADQNENYTGAPIVAGDAPTLGDEVLISDSGAVAFDIGSSWVDANDLMDVASAVGPLPKGGSLMATYFTANPSTSVGKTPTLVMVVEGAPPGQIGPIDLKFAHDNYIKGALAGLDKSGMTATTTEAVALTTTNGLDGLVTSLSLDSDGVPIRAYEYTFVRSQRVVYVQIMSYDGSFDDATAALVTDSLRINK